MTINNRSNACDITGAVGTSLVQRVLTRVLMMHSSHAISSSSTMGIETIEDVTHLQKIRTDHRKSIARSIDMALAKTHGAHPLDDDESHGSLGCFGRLGFVILTTFSRVGHGSSARGSVVVSASSPSPATAATAQETWASQPQNGPSSSHLNQGWGLRLFGRSPGTSSSAAAHLARAAASLSQHVDDLERRAAHHRSMAAEQMKGGNKRGALAQLKRSKQLEAMAESKGKTISAVERQADMLEEAGLQTQVANALQAGVRDNKKLKKAMKNVESVTDDAEEFADTVAEVNETLAQLGSVGFNEIDEDDDELIEELNTMLSSDANEELGSPKASVVPTAAPTGTSAATGVEPYRWPKAPTSGLSSVIESLPKGESDRQKLLAVSH